MKKLIIAFSVCGLLCSCGSDDAAYQEINGSMPFAVPANFPAPAQDIGLNPPTTKGFELGRKLFYDGRLSADGTISCSFCHEQGYAFTHHGHQLSHGINDLEGIRNAPPVQNMAFQGNYFWDGAAESIELLSINPIHNPVEMDETLEGIVAKLRQDPEYVKLFGLAFDDGQVSSGNTLKALGQFMTMMVSANSRYDRYVRSEGGQLTAQEVQGMGLFQQNCAICHKTDLFTDSAFRNNGLPPNVNLNDLGREGVTGFASDRYKFKVPSLRNIEKTAPYMHDGRFGSLESVLNFYSSGIMHSATLDPVLQQGGTLGIPLTPVEKQAIIAFLKTLTDEEYLSNPLFYYRT
ncbi:cytochrome c peroxidase [Flavobacterium sp. DGU11]|uniref:Cytochrome c peroxidase n=1 Tax=Flavobacterium arundinis TaxID=3139143 RepID=A0ABU9HV36_9FLAO